MTRNTTAGGSPTRRRMELHPGDVCPRCDARCKVLVAHDGGDPLCSNCLRGDSDGASATGDRKQ